jgi:quercetin dioxygenase-like cupin family protein
MKPLHPAPSLSPLLIGAKLRNTRLGQGLTIAQVADSTSPGVATLVTIRQVLSLPIGTLFEPPENVVVALEDAPLINMGGLKAVERLLTPRNESKVQVQVLRSTLDPGTSGGEELYTINCDVEVLHVLRGEVILRFSRSDLKLTAGDTVTVAGREPHSWTNPTAEVAEVIWTIVPAAWSGSSSAIRTATQGRRARRCPALRWPGRSAW